MHVTGHQQGLALEHCEHLGGGGEHRGLLVVPQGRGVVEVVPGGVLLQVPHGGACGGARLRGRTGTTEGFEGGKWSIGI